MSTAITIPREDQTDAGLESARRCIVTGEVRPKDELIRFVATPDSAIIPDLAQNLPGRGLWVTAERKAIEMAGRKNLFAKAAKASMKTDPGLADLVAALLSKRCLDLLGLACGAGIAVLGQPQVEAALKTGQMVQLFIADDAAANGLGKINPGSAAVTRHFNRRELGAALGYEQVVYVGLKAHNLTDKLRRALLQLENIAGTHHLSLEVDNGTK